MWDQIQMLLVIHCICYTGEDENMRKKGERNIHFEEESFPWTNENNN